MGETSPKKDHPTDPDRYADGTLKAGHKKPGPGRPSAATERAYLEAFKKSVPVRTFAKLVKQAVVHALQGDGTALKLLFQFALPQPTSRNQIELSLDRDEVRWAGHSVADVDEQMACRLRELLAERGKHQPTTGAAAAADAEGVEPESSCCVSEPQE